MLQNIIINLQDKVTAFRLVLSPFLPSDISCLDDPDRACIEAERHSRELAANFTLINSSRPALEEAQTFLDSLQEIPDIDFAGLNATAQSAISISTVALGKLSSSNVSATLRSASEEESTSRQVAAVVAALQGDAMTELSGARQQLNRSREQEARFVQLENTVTSLNDTVQELIMLPDLAVEARRLNRTANEISIKLVTSRNRVDEIERRLPNVQERVRNLTTAVRESELLLNRTDENSKHVFVCAYACMRVCVCACVCMLVSSSVQVVSVISDSLTDSKATAKGITTHKQQYWGADHSYES